MIGPVITSEKYKNRDLFLSRISSYKSDNDGHVALKRLAAKVYSFINQIKQHNLNCVKKTIRI